MGIYDVIYTHAPLYGTRGGALGVFRDFGVPRVLGASGVAGILEFGGLGSWGPRGYR